MDDIVLRPIGHVCNNRPQPLDRNWGSVESTIRINTEWQGALDGLDQFSHVQVLTYLHKVTAHGDQAPVHRHPRNRPDLPLLGVFAQRARIRPNPIGLTACRIVHVETDQLVVRGLDAIDGTPVLDIKPYVPQFDRVDKPRVPEWVGRLMVGFF